jgi:hypothetical protein
MALVVAVAAVSGLLPVELVEIPIDRRRHLTFDDLGQRLASNRAVAFAPVETVGTHRLHELKRHR